MNNISKKSFRISGYYSFRSNIFVTNVSYRVRKKIYELFVEQFPDAKKIADVGVAAEEISKEANVLESLYPYKSRITAIGIEDAGFLEKKYPGMKFVEVDPSKGLPFSDNYFDVVYCHAVIEHIVDKEQRNFFLKEIVRIGKCTFITTPNRYFPIEHHTGIPLLHIVFPKLFYFLLDQKLLNKFYSSSNLSLLSEKELKELARGIGYHYRIFRVRFLFFVSNLVLIIYKDR